MNWLRLLILFSIYTCMSAASAADTLSARNALEVYNQELAQETPGVYSRAGMVFVIAEQPCLKRQKYAGTRESKAATAQAFALMADFAMNGRPGISREGIGVRGALGDDIFQRYRQQQSAKAGSVSASGSRILDTGTGGCVRRVVFSLPAEAFSQVSRELNFLPDVSALKQQLFAEALASEDYSRLSVYFDSLGLPELALGFAPRQEGRNFPLYPVVINWHRDGQQLAAALKQCEVSGQDSSRLPLQTLSTLAGTAFCGEQVSFSDTGLDYLDSVDAGVGRFSTAVALGDPSHVVRLVLKQRGFVLFKPTGQTERVGVLNDQAQKLFNEGRDAPEIVRLYSQSLNANPMQPQAWAQLGSVMLAFENSGAANALFIQALLQEPGNTDYWLNLASSLNALDNQQQARKLVAEAAELSSVFPVTPWGSELIRKVQTAL